MAEDQEALMVFGDIGDGTVGLLRFNGVPVVHVQSIAPGSQVMFNPSIPPRRLTLRERLAKRLRRWATRLDGYEPEGHCG